jgi:hypothetical protein
LDLAGDDQEPTKNDDGVFQPTRRSVLIGAAAIAASGPAYADDQPTENLQLDFLDKIRRQVVVLIDVSGEDKFKSQTSTPVVTDAKERKFLLSWDRRDFGPNASFKIERVSGEYFKDGRPTAHDNPEDPAKVATWLPLKWTLTVSNASFPGNEKFPGDPRHAITESTIVFTFARPKLDKRWTISATMTRWWQSRADQLVAGEVCLKDFCDGKSSLCFAVNSEQNRLLSSLFGERIEARTPFRLEVDQGIRWSIDAGDRAATAKVGRLYILDIPLEFGRLKLTRIRSDLVSATDQRSKTSAGEMSEEAAGGATKFLFETEVTHGRPLKVSDRFFPDGLYGAIENVTGFTTPNTDTPASEDIKPIWKFDFAAKRLDGVDAAVGLEFDRPAISFGPLARDDRRAPVAAAIRHWGYPDHTVAGCVVTSVNDLQGIGRLNVKHGPAKSEIVDGPFEFAGFEIVRQYHAKAGAVITRLSAHPVSKETAVDLQLGSIGVAGLPSVSSKPGVAPRVPQIVVEATEKVDAADKDRRQLSGFSARLALSSAAMRLPERVEVAPGKPAEVFPGKHVTRLDFQDADALLYLPALGPQPATSADAVLPIGPARAPNMAIFDLGRARLTVLRPSDLLALKFRFSGLELIAPWPPARDQVAELAPRGSRSPGRPFAQTAGGSAAPRDERPLLVVEFPPQHIVEQAYFRQLPEKLDLPELEIPAENAADVAAIKEALTAPKKWSRSRRGKAAAQWRSWVAELVSRVCGEGDDTLSTTGCERTALRKVMRKAANWPVPPDDKWPDGVDKALFLGAGAVHKKISDFDRSFTARASALPQPLPEEQRVYIGADYLEPDARRIALEVLRELKLAEVGAGQPIKWPLVKDLEKGDWKDFFRPFVESKRLKSLDDVPEQEKWPDKAAVDKAFGADNDLLGQEVLNEIERARERRDHDYAAFRQTYRMLARATSLPPQQREYFGNEWFLQLLALTGTDKLSATFVSDLTKALSASDREAFAPVVPARLSGPSRIAFRVDCDDFEPDRPAGRIPFTLEGLTNWGGMDMVVVRRAERLMEPLQGTRLPPRWGRRALTDEGAMLRFQGFTSSERWGPATETRRREPAQAAVTATQRLAEVYASSARAPDLFETAIELPFRLFLSPAQDATWMTTAPRVRRDAGLSEDIDAFRELWTARLTGREQEAGVRAVWSPDYRPEALLSTAAPGAPPIGPYAPWALPRSFGLRTSPDREIERFRTGLEAFDRHELVVLSSVHGLPVLGRRAPTGDLAPDADQIEPPAGFRLRGLLPEKIENQDTDMTAIYRPKPLSVNELSLSALGGNLDVDAGFQPPASARSLLDRRNLFDALSIERWRQRTVLGRDIVVEVVYKGFLFPLGHRASLVKLTERRFMKVDGRESPMAILVQRLFLKIGKPEKRYQAEGQPNRGSRWPCERVVMLTRQTPDLVDARSDQPTGTLSEVFARGRIGLGKGTTGLCMWPRTSARPGAEVWFEMQIGDEAVPVRLPLIFVDNIAANDETTVANLIEYYNDKDKVAADSGSPTRKLLRNGQPVVMAPEYKSGDTTFDTAWWRVTAEGRERNPPQKTGHDPIVIDNANYIRDSFMEGQDQPPFYPVVDRARCRLKSVERFTGSGPLWADVTFDGDYVAYGIDYVDPPRAGEEKGKPSEIYLRILPADGGDDTLPLDFENRGELGGGVARPTMDVVAISRSLGPINGGTKGAPPGAPAPAPPSETSNQLPVLDRIRQFEDSINIFPKGKFLGIMELSKLVEAVLGVNLHPKLTDVIEYGAASLKSVAGDAANEVAGAVAGAATDVRSALTQALISPAAEAVAEVQKAWIAIAKKRLGGDAKVPNLEEIYPQVGQDLDGLAKLLDKAKQPGTPDVAFFDSLSAILEAARRLTRTIDAIARDPLAAAAGAQVELFKKLLDPIEAVRAALSDFSKIGELPRQLPDMLREIARIILVKKIKRVAQIVDESTAPAQSVIKIVEDSVKASLPAVWTLEKLAKFPNDLATRLKDKITPLGPGSYEFQTLDPVVIALTSLADEIAKVEQATADAKKDLADLEKEADAAAQEQIVRLRETADQIERRAIEKLIELLLSPTVMTVLRIVADAQAMRAAIPTAPLDDKKFEQLLTAVSPALDILAVIGGNSVLAKLLATTDAFCANVEANIKSTLVAASTTLLPPIGVLEIKSGGSTGTDAPILDVNCDCSVPVRAIHAAANTASVALGFDTTSKDKFDKAAGKVFAQIGQLYKSLKAFNDEVALLPTAGCAPLKSDLIVKMRDVVAQQRALSTATENLAKTTVEILTSPSLQAAAQTAARGALIDFLVAAIEKTPDLTLLNNLPKPGVPNPFDAFAAAITKLADLLRPTLPRTAASLDRLAADQRALSDLDFRKKALEEAKKTLILGVAEFRNSGTLGLTAQNALNGAKGQLILAQKATFARMERAFSADLNDLLAPAVAQMEDSLSDVIGQITSLTSTVVGGALPLLITTYDLLLKNRRSLNQEVAKAPPVVGRVLDLLARELGAGQTKADLFNVYDDADKERKSERLTQESIRLKAANAKWATDQAAAMAELGALADAWRRPALVELVRRFGRIKSSFLRIVVVEALDLRALRSELDRIVRELVPTRATLSYDLGTPVREFSLPGVGKVFLPAKGTRLDVKMRASIDLLNPQKPDARIDGHMGPFGIQLFGDFDVVLLNFRGLDFRAGGGRPSGFDVRFGDFVIGEKAKFLKQLEAYISPKGGLPPVRPMKDKPGIEATYGINLGSFGVGTLSFSNVSLNAGARLPFGATDEAEFIVSIGRSDAPFLISSTIFGGGGYLALLANGKGFIGLESSFDYGGVFTFGFGPLSGTGQITLGLYFRAARGEPSRLGMNFMARGAANIACFSFSASLFVRLTYVGGQMNGRATYTFSFSIGIDDIDFTFEVFVSQGASAGSGSPTAFLDLPGMPALTQFASASPEILNAYARMGAKAGASESALDMPKPELRVRAPSQKKHWKKYRNLFDPALKPVVEI